MSFVIDGHNLIPKIPGFNLRQIDDELALVNLLQEFYPVKRKPLEVFFDRASAGNSGTRKFGTVNVHFVRQGMQADDAIINRVRKAGKGAANLIVVSSDHRVQNEVKALHAQVMTSESFASMLVQSLSGAPKTGNINREIKESEEEIEEWIRLFNRKG